MVEETGLLVEKFMSRLEVTTKEDAKLTRQSKATINNLKKLLVLIGDISK